MDTIFMSQQKTKTKTKTSSITTTTTTTTTTEACCSKADLKNLCNFLVDMEAPCMLGYTQTWEEWRQQFTKMMHTYLKHNEMTPEETKECGWALKTFNDYPAQAGDFGLVGFVVHFEKLRDSK